jgi:hypothetical protein
MKARGITFSDAPKEMQWGPFAAILDSEGFHNLRITFSRA